MIAPSNSCSRCNDEGWVFDATANVARPCECQRLRKVNLLMETALIPPRYRNQTLDMIRPESPEQVAAISRLEQYAKDWPNRLLAGDGVALTGAVSRAGKTHLACATARSIASQHQLPYEIGERYPILYLNISEFINSWRTFHAQPGSPDGQGDPKHWSEHRRLAALERRAQTCQLLILDEVGEVSATEFVTQKLYLLIEHRCSHLLPLIVTSNLSLEQIGLRYGDGGARIAGRLEEMTSECSIRL